MHAESQQHPGVHVPFNSAHMQLVLRSAAASGLAGTSVQSTGCCWNGIAAEARGKRGPYSANVQSNSSTARRAVCWAQQRAELLLLVITAVSCAWMLPSAAAAAFFLQERSRIQVKNSRTDAHKEA